jgi:hypothetical protein
MANMLQRPSNAFVHNGMLLRLARESVVPCLAATMALVSTAWFMNRNPFKNCLGAYDFRSPETALKSYLTISARGDALASRELEYLSRKKLLEEKLQTLKVAREFDHKGSKLLFVGFLENRVPQREVLLFDKHAATGWWQERKTFSVVALMIGEPVLSKQISAWKDAGILEP